MNPLKTYLEETKEIRYTLMQTLSYGVYSALMYWHKEGCREISEERSRVKQ